MKKRFSLLIVALALIFGLVVGAAASGVSYMARFGDNSTINYATKFATIMKVLDTSYVGEIEKDKVSDAAYGAMVAAIDDRWSYYMNAETYETYQQFQKNSYNGVGITIVADEDSKLLKVAGVSEDSPAAQAGILPGELLCEIDGKELTGMTAGEVKAIITEKQGQLMKFLLQAEDGSRRTVELSTKDIFTNPVKSELMEDSVGYIRIKNFEGGSADGVIGAIEELRSRGAQFLVFDVRNNPGGLLSELIKILDYILPQGTIFISMDENGKETTTSSDEACVNMPMAVLINENSYSAAEFFAAALSEYEWATTVGAQTSGKARSQISIELSDGSAVHISTNSYFTPKHVDLAATGGLTPNVAVSINEQQAEYLAMGKLPKEDDPQLKAAVDSLKT